MTVTMYPDWYLAFCVVFLIVFLIVLSVISWRHKP